MATARHVVVAGPVEGWRANIPIIRTIATSASIILSVVFLTWQGSQWVGDMRSEVRELRTTLVAITRTLEEKAALKDMEFKFALQCARAPVSAKSWVCGTEFSQPRAVLPAAK